MPAEEGMIAVSGSSINNQIRPLLEVHGVREYGVCAFADCQPLLPCRAASRIPDRARSVIVCLFPYYTGELQERNVARYAVLPDYHRVAGDILAHLSREMERTHPKDRFAPFVDSSPIPEVRAASLAGLGVVGRHGLLLTPEYGGFVLIGSVVTTLPLPVSAPGKESCLECGRCAAACPTGALGGEVFERDRCRSHITQKKRELTPWEREQIRAGGLAWGCDICTDACPMNRRRPTTVRAFYENPAPVLTADNLDRLLPDKAYGYRGRGVLERNLRILRGER